MMKRLLLFAILLGSVSLTQIMAGNGHSGLADFQPTMKIYPAELPLSGQIPEGTGTGLTEVYIHLEFPGVPRQDLLDVDASDFVVTNGTVGTISYLGLDLGYTITVTPTTFGEVSINLPAAMISRDTGDTNLQVSTNFIFDDLVTAQITVANQTNANNNFIFGPFTATITFDEDVTGFEVSDLDVTRATTSNLIAVSGSVYTVDLTPTVTSGTVKIQVKAGKVQNSNGVLNEVSEFLTLNYDTSLEVTISNEGGDPVSANPIIFNFDFTEAVTGFDLTDLTVTNGTAANLSGSGASYTAEITPIAEGEVTVIVAPFSFFNSEGNKNHNGASHSVTSDLTGPDVVISSGASGVVTAAFQATFTFSESTSDFELADISLANAVASNLSGSGTTFTADITPSGSGTISISLSGGVFTDAAGNGNVASTPFSIEADLDSPSLVISSDVSGTATGTFQATFTFTENVTGFEQSNIVIANASISGFSGTGSVYTANITPVSDGTVTIDVATEVASDNAGNPNTAASTFTIPADLTDPSLTITTDLTGTATGTYEATFTFSEIVTGFDVSDISVWNGTISNLSGADNLYTADITPSSDGNVRVKVEAETYQDAAGRTSPVRSELNVTADITAPTVTISPGNSMVVDPLRNQVLWLGAEFSEDYVGFDQEDIVISSGTFTLFHHNTVSPRAQFNLTDLEQGTLTVSIPAGAFTDEAGNPNEASNVLSVEVEWYQPVFSIREGGDPNPNGQVTIDLTFDYDASVYLHPAGNGTEYLTLENATLVEADHYFVNGDYVYKKDWSLTVEPINNGPVTLNFANFSWEDEDFTYVNYGEVSFSFDSDRSIPGVVISADASGTVGSTFQATFTFDEVVTGFDISDIDLVNATASNLTGSGSVYTADIAPSADGNVTIDVAASVAKSILGVGNTAAVQYSVNADITEPDLVITSAVGNRTNANPFEATFTFSESVTGFELADIVVGNGVASNLAQATDDGSTYTADITASAENTIAIVVAADKATDAAGNGNTLAQLNVEYDFTGPTVTITNLTAEPKESSAFEASITFDEEILGLSSEDISVTGGTLSGIATITEGLSYTATIDHDNSGEVTVEVAAGNVEDLVGNVNANAASLTVDTFKPVLVSNVTMNPVYTSGTFRKSATVQIYVFFDGDITRNGSEIYLEMETGDIDARATFANYSSSLKRMLFNLNIQEGYETDDLDYTTINALTIGSGTTITDGFGNNVDLTLPEPGSANSISAQNETRIDAVAPKILSVTSNTTNGAYVEGDVIEIAVVLSETTTDEATLIGNAEGRTLQFPKLTLETGDTDREVAYVSGLGTSTLIFQYTVQAGDSSPDLSYVSSTALHPGGYLVGGVLDLESGGIIVDEYYNVLDATLPEPGENGSLSANADIKVITGPLTVELSSDESDPTNSSAFEIAVDFNRPVTGFESSDLVLTNAVASNLIGSGASYTLDITPTADGEVSINLPASMVVDAANNGNEAANQLSISVDQTAPTAIISSTESSPTNQESFTVNILFSEEVPGFSLEYVYITNAIASNGVSDGNNYSFTVTPDVDGGEVTITLETNETKDLVGNAVVYTPFTIESDKAVPSVELTASNDGPLNSTFTASFTFNETVTGFEEADISLTNGTLSNFSGTGTDYTVDVTPVADGNVTLQIAAAVAHDVAGNGNSASDALVVEADFTGPVATIVVPTKIGAVGNNVLFNVNEPTSGFDVSDIIVSNATVSNFQQVSELVYSIEVVPSSDATVTVAVAASAFTDAAGNQNEATAESQIPVDLVAPETTVALSGIGDPNNTDNVTINLSFNEPVLGNISEKLSLTNATLVETNGDDDTNAKSELFVTVAPIADGLVTLSFAADSWEDEAFNTNTEALDFSFTSDRTGPAVSMSGAPTGDSFIVTFSFDQEVTDFVQSDIVLGNATGSNFTGSGDTYTLTLVGIEYGESLTVNIPANRVTDELGNGNAAADQLSISQSFFVPTMTLFDNYNSPSLTDEIDEGGTAYTDPVYIYLKYPGVPRQDQLDVEASDFVVTNGAVTGVSYFGLDLGYLITVDPTTAKELVQVTLPAGTTSRPDGDTNVAASTSFILAAAPEVEITVEEGDTAANGYVFSNFVVTFTFDEDVTGFVKSDFTVTNGTKKAFTVIDGSTYTQVVNLKSAGDIIIDLPAGRLKNAQNVNNEAAQLTLTYDPSFGATITSASSPASGNNVIPFAVSFTEDVTNFDLSSLEITNGTASNLAGSGANYTLDVTAIAEGDVIVKIPALAVEAVSGNKNRDASELTVAYDISGPTVNIAMLNGDLVGAWGATVRVEFDEDVVGFTKEDVIVTNARVDGLNSASSIDPLWNIYITPLAEGPITIQLPAGVLEDALGNLNSASNLLTLETDLAVNPPVFSIADGTDPNNQDQIRVNVTFDEEVYAYLYLDDCDCEEGVLLNNATLVETSYDEDDYGFEHYLIVSPIADGPVTITIQEYSVEDDYGNYNEENIVFTFQSDRTAPSLNITSAETDPTNNETFEAIFTFSESVNDFTIEDIQITNGTVANLSGSGNAYKADITAAAIGAVTVTVAAEAAADDAGNMSLGGSYTLTYAGLGNPEVILSTLESSPTNAAAFTVNFTFADDVTGFEASDVLLQNAAISNFSGSGKDYTATIAPSGDGIVTVDVPADVAAGPRGDGNLAATQLSILADYTAPDFTLSSDAPDVTNAAVVKLSFTVTGEALDENVFSVSNGSMSSVYQEDVGSNIWFADITPESDGLVTVNFGEGHFYDEAGNVSSEQSFSFTSDRTAPSVELTAATLIKNTFTTSFTFSEPVTGFDLSDIVVGNGTASNFTGSGAVYTADISPMADGNVTIDIAAAVGTDEAGNGNTANQTIVLADLTAPGLVISTSTLDPTNGNTFEVTFTFDESVTGFEASDIVAGNGTISNFAGSGGIYTADITPTVDGAVTVDVAASSANDEAGNGNTAASQLSITADLTSPTVTISTSEGNPTNADVFTVSIAFSESVTGFDLADVTVGNGVASNLSGTGANYTADITPSADGPVTVDLNAGIAEDQVGNENTAANQLSITSDKTAPTVNITTTAGLVNGTFETTFTFSESVIDFTLSDITVSNGTATNFAGSGTVYTADIIPTSDGNVTVEVASAVVTDSGGNGNTANQTSVVADLTAPALVITTDENDPANGDAFLVTFTFDESVTGFEVGDIVAGNGTVSNFVGSGATYTANITPVTDGAVTVDVAANAANDEAGNGNVAASQLSITADLTAPTVTISTSEGNPTNADAITVSIAFSESVTGFDLADITVSNAVASNLSGSGANYTASIAPSADGTVTVDLTAGVAEDAAGNNNQAASQLSIVSDRTAPAVTVSTGATSPIDGSFDITFTFSETVTGFEQSDIAVGNGTASDFSGSGAGYSAKITPATDGAVTVDIAAGAGIDAAGNGNTAATQLSLIADLTSPFVVISSDESNPSNATPFTVTFTFSESVTGFDLTDVIVNNGTASNFSGSGAVYSADITPATDGVVTIDVSAEAASDEAGNGNIAASQFSLIYDITGPAVSITSTASDVVFATSFTASVTFSEAVSDFTADDLTLVNATASNFTGSGLAYTVEIAPIVDGEVAVSIGANVAPDALGNLNTASNTITKTVEATNEAPTAIILSGNTIAENTVAGTEIGTLSATDVDLGDSHSFLLVSGDGDTGNSAFDIIGQALVTTEVFDFETQNSYSVRIRATDAKGLTLDVIETITVTNANEPALTVTIPDPADETKTVTDISFDNVRVGQTSQRTFTVTNSGTDGDLIVSGITVPTGFTSNVTSFTLSAGVSEVITVTFGPTAEQTYAGLVAISTNIGESNFAIAGSGEVNNAPVAIVPASTYHYSVGSTLQLNGYDPDGDAITYQIVTQPTLGTLTATGNDGEYTFAPNSLSPETLYTDKIEFQVVETEGGLASETAEFNFSFEVVDAAHSITAFNAGDITNNARTMTLSFDDVVLNDNYIIDISYYDLSDASAPAFVSLKSESVSKSDLTLTATGASLSFDVNSTDFAYLFTASQVFVTASVSTPNGFSDTEAFVLTNTSGGGDVVVLGDTDGQFFIFAETVTVPENQTATLKLNAVDLGGFDLSNATLEVTENPVHGITGNLTLIKASSNLIQWSIDYNADTEVGLTDSFGFSVYSPARDQNIEASAAIEVIEVNDAPVLASITDQQTNEDQAITVPLSIVDPDSETAITVTSSETSNVPVTVEGDNLVITPGDNFNGEVNVTVLVSEIGEDSPLNTFQQFTLTVEPVNDRPVVSAINDLTIQEDGQVVISLAATDVDAELPIFTFSATSDRPNDSEVIIGGTSMTINPAANFNGELTFSVYADDRLGTNASVSEAETFTVTVTSVNDAPQISNNFSIQSVVQGFPAYSLDLAQYFTDVETEAGNLNYTVTDINNVSLDIAGSVMTINTVSGAVGVESAIVTASDGELSVSQTITFVTSEASGQVTVANSLDNLELTEDFDQVSIDLSDVFAYSEDDNATFSYALSGNNNLEASMKGNVLEITTPENFNGSDIIFIVASTNGESAFTSFGITVSPVNDSPELVQSSADYTASEDAIFFQSVAASAFADIDGDDLTYTATYDADWLNFDPKTGIFSGIPANDNVGDVVVTLTATDPSGESVSDGFTITVINTNDDPTDLSLSNTVLSENELSGFLVGTLSTTDVDAGDNFVYALVSGDGDADNTFFTIAGNKLLTGDVLDYEAQASYSIRIQTTDASGASITEAFIVSLDNVNEAVTDISLDKLKVDENQSAGTVVGALASTDGDANDTFTYALVEGEGADDNDLFAISGSELVTSSTFDFETRSAYQVRIQSTDAGGLAYEEAFTITVDNVNEAITDLTLSNTTVNENLAVTSAIGLLNASDPDLSDAHTYTLVSGAGADDNELFSLDGNTLRLAGLLNYESQTAYSLRVKVEDNGGLSFEKIFTIDVNDVNEAATDLALDNLVIAENAGASALVGGFTTTDEDSNDTHSYALVNGAGATDNDAFEISGTSLVAKAGFDFETQSSYSVRVQTTDAGGLSYAESLSITVSNVNEVATDINLDVTSIDENNEIGAVVGAMTTIDEDLNDSHSYSLVAGEGDTGNSAFAISGSELTTAESFDFEAQEVYAIRIRTTDAEGLSFDKAFQITINDVTEAIAAIRVEGELTFAATALGDIATLDYTIYNDGNADLSISSIGYPEGFTGNWSEGVVPGGENRVVTVTFSPIEEKSYDGTIQIISNLDTTEHGVSGEGAIITAIDDPLQVPLSVRAYPNPVSDILIIDLAELNGKEAQVGLWTMNGLSKFNTDRGMTNELKIDVSTYQEGIYLLRVTSEGRTVTKKIMIKR